MPHLKTVSNVRRQTDRSISLYSSLLRKKPKQAILAQIRCKQDLHTASNVTTFFWALEPYTYRYAPNSRKETPKHCLDGGYAPNKYQGWSSK
jgi:hypothetical protein